MAGTFGVNFLIGAHLQSSVGSAFASLGSRMQALRQSFRNAERQSSALGDIIAKQRELSNAMARAKAQKQATGVIDKKLVAEIKNLSQSYEKAAQAAGVYGQSLDQIIARQRRMVQEAQASQARLRNMQMVEDGRNLRQSGSNQRASAYGAAAQTVTTIQQLAKPLKIGMEFEEAMSQVKAISRASAEDMARLEAQARQLGATTVWSAKEAAEGMTYLSMAGFKTNETLAAMPGMLSLASAGGIALGQTADIASNILTGFGLKAEDMGKVGDILAKTFTNSNTTLTSLGETFKYAAPAAAKAKQSFEDTAAMIAMLGNAGVQGSMAGTALNAMMLRMASPPKMANDAMAALGVSLSDSTGKIKAMPEFLRELGFKMKNLTEIEQIDLARKIFGLENAKSGLILMEQAMSGELQKFSQNVYEKGFSDKVAKDQIDNLSGDLKSLNSAAEEVAISLYQTLSPALRGMTQGITEIVRPVGEWIKANPQLVHGIMLVGGALVGLKAAGIAFTFLGGLQKSFVGGVISMRGQVGGAVTGITGVFGRLRSELARPVNVNAGSFKASMEGMKVKMESVRNKALQTAAAMRFLTPAAMAAGAKAAASGAMAATGRAGFNILRMGVRGVGMAFKTMFGPMSLFMMALSFGAEYIMENWEKIKPFFEALWEGVKACFNSVMGWLQPLFDKIMGFIGPMIDGVGKAMEGVGAVWNWFFGDDEKKQPEKKAAEQQKQAPSNPNFGAAMAALDKQEQAAVNPVAAEAAVVPQAGQAAVKTPEQLRQEEQWAQEGLAGKRKADAMEAQKQAEKEAKKAAREKKASKKGKPEVLAKMQAAASGESVDEYGEITDDYGDSANDYDVTPQAPPRKKSAAKKNQAVQSESNTQAPTQSAPPQIIQPQVQVAVNVTQNGVPDQEFATGVMNAIRQRQAELEKMISALVHEQARLAYSG